MTATTTFSRHILASDCSQVGLTDPDEQAAFVAAWTRAAQAEGERRDVTIRVLDDEDGGNDPNRLSTTHDDNGDLTIAGEIWQAAHDATPVQ